MGSGVFAFSLELGDAGAFFLSVLEALLALGLEFAFEPFGISASQFELLLEGLLTVLGTVELALGVLLGLLQGCDLARQLDISLVLLGQLLGDGLVALVVGLDDAEVGSVGRLDCLNLVVEGLDLGRRGQSSWT